MSDAARRRFLEFAAGLPEFPTSILATSNPPGTCPRCTQGVVAAGHSLCRDCEREQPGRVRRKRR